MKSIIRTLGPVSIVGLALVAAVVFAADPGKPAAPTTAPVDGPAPATAPAAEVSPEAEAVLKDVGAAYLKLKTLDLVGSMAGDFDVAGEKQNQKVEFTTAYATPNKFKHDVKDEALMGSTGEKFYIYTRERNLYLMADAPDAKVMSELTAHPTPLPFGNVGRHRDGRASNLVG